MYLPQLEPAAPIHPADRNHAHYPSRHCTILKKRWLNDRLLAHMIPSTREIIRRCLHVHLTHQIHGVADVFPRSWRATSQTAEAPNPWHQTREIINPKEEGSQNIYEWKNHRRASVHAETRTYPPIRPADRNHAHYPSRHRTILKKRQLDDGLPGHANLNLF